MALPNTYNGSIVYEVSAEVDPTDSGTITGTGTYPSGSNMSLLANAKSGYVFDYWQLDGFTRLEYIESTGTQYIDTGITIPYAQTEIELDLSLTRQSGSHCIFGTSYQRAYGYMVNYYDASTDVWLYFGTEGSYVRKAYVSATSNNTRHTAKLTNTGFYVNDTLAFKYNASGFTSNTPDTLKLFCSGNTTQGSIGFQSSMKLYGGTIKNNGVLIANYIPVKKKSTNEVGLLNLVDLSFKGNKGTGTFNTGQELGDVEWTSTNNPLSLVVNSDISLIANFKRSANCRYKVNGAWKNAMMYIKQNGTWKPGTPKIKVNGNWKEGG